MKEREWMETDRDEKLRYLIRVLGLKRAPSFHLNVPYSKHLNLIQCAYSPFTHLARLSTNDSPP